MAVDIDSLQIEIEATSSDATAQIDRLRQSLDDLRQMLNGSATSANNSAAAIGRVSKAVSGANSKTTSWLKRLSKMTIAGVGIYRVTEYIKTCVRSVTDYVENVNLFQVSMGEFYDEAFAYAQLVSDKMGVDPSEWMRNQGVFMSMANGFGLAREQAYALSEGLTELSYDLSSLYNEDVEQAALRLQSALAGEVEPIRRLGISISQATLQEYALAHGIEESVTAMTEQEKALLRSLVLMEGAARVGAIGDFAKTLESPANAMRVLSQQITQMGRAIGSTLLPVLVQVIPWIQAFVEIITEAINRFAAFIGFTVPEWDAQDWSGGIIDGASAAEDAIDGVSSAAKAAKKALLGIDELTILEPTSAGGVSTGSGTGGWATDLVVPDIWDKSSIEAIRTQADDLKRQLEPILDMITDIGVGLAAWKIATTLPKALDKIVKGLKAGVKNLSKWDKLSRSVAGVITLAAGIKWSYEGGYEVGRGTAEFGDYLKAVLGPIAAGVGGALIGSVIPGIGTGIGFAIGVTIGVVMEMVGVIKGRQQSLVDEFYASDFGQQVQDLRTRIQESTQITEDIHVRISNISTEIDEDALANLTIAKDLLNDIFYLNDQQNLTSGELALIAEKVEILNGLGLEGLQIDLDPNGRIVQTKEDLQGVIDKLHEQYQLEAAKDALVSAYREQYNALVDIKEKNDQYTESLGYYNEAAQNTKDIEQELMQVEQDLNEIREEGQEIGLDYRSWPEDLKAAFDPLYDRSVELRTELEKQNTAMTETRAAVEEAAGALSGSLDTYDLATEKVNTVESAFVDLIDTVGAQVTPATQDAKNIMTGIADGIASGQPVVTDAIEQAMQNLLEAERIFNDINSPSGLYRNEALYVMQGFASGISGNIKLVTSAMSSMLNALLSQVESFTNSCRSAMNNMISDMAAAMQSVQVNSTGSISYRKLSPVSIPEVQAYSSGGFPNYGEMFIAREDGPELVGRIGSRSAVANNDQIVEGIASANDGVINAIYAMAQRIVTAIEENGGDIYVESDGTATQNRKNRMYGKTLQYI